MTHPPFASGTVLARTAPGVAADLFAVVEARPVAHFAVEGGEGEFAQGFGPRLVFDAGLDLA